MVRPRQKAQQQQQQQQSERQAQDEDQQCYRRAQDEHKQYLRTESHQEQDPNQLRQEQQQQPQTEWQRSSLQQQAEQQQPQQQQELQPSAAPPRVHVKFLGGKRARGLVASEPIETAEVIYTEERPLLAVQHEFSRFVKGVGLCGLTCCNCLRFVGSLKDCIRHVLTQAGRHEPLADLQLLPETFIEKAGLSLGPVVPCGESDCPAVFCSQECREHARRETFHRMVCVEAADRSAWLVFLSHARRHHDGLMMAGACVAQVVFEVLFKGRQFADALRPFRQFYSAPWESLAPDRVAAGGSSASLRGSRTETAEGRRSLLLESLALLKRVLDPIISCYGDPSLRDTLDSILQLDSYSRLLGTFALVCLDVEFPHPLNRRLLDLQRALSRFSHRRPDHPEGLSGVPIEVPPPSGPLQGSSPELQDTSAEDEQHAPVLRKVRALRSIDAEEEVTVSYIDEALPLHERRQMLQKHYGFSCTCPRCVVEATEALLVVMKAPECADGAKLEELVARRTGLPLAVVTEVRQYSRRLTKP
ncbi:uncharacterized protein EMH_0052570 [Eimeria mitis]|uniref:SET domain-containing protein n=1 Tax=Eimeria mitis TaxID=44415 RepID=U6KAH9_9EIME|nr:uncharacterized protein EMH_0052570 [Eimeria mitis]CDJ33227.1 hypothetical protein, conserved [Eimeria mitis]